MAPQAQRVVKMRKRNTHDVLLSDVPIGMIVADYGRLTAYDSQGNKLGTYTGHDAKEAAADAIQTAWEAREAIATVASTLGGTVVSVDFERRTLGGVA